MTGLKKPFNLILYRDLYRIYFKKYICSTAVRQGSQEQGLLQAVPGQVPQAPRGQDRLLCPQASRRSGQEQVQHAQVPHGRQNLQQGYLLPGDHLKCFSRDWDKCIFFLRSYLYLYGKKSLLIM